MNNAADLEHARDWEWLVGRWNVRHRKLKSRLAGAADWAEFGGSCTSRLTMNGLGVIDDYLIEQPDGSYRAMAVRGFDRATRQWSIWWLDDRNATTLGEPVRGGFRDGVGAFIGGDMFNGRPIKVRFIWSDLRDSPRWEQAFSPDNGATWEVNWVMRFTRLA